MASTPSHPIFHLPLELRLEIYSNCTALSLLQLSHVCTFFRSEINRYPSIIKSTRGFKLGPSIVEEILGKTPREFLPGMNHCRQFVLCCSEEEMPLWRELFDNFPRDPELHYGIDPDKRRYYCEGCWNIGYSYEFDVDESDERRGPIQQCRR
ncbi:hypothetical protein BJ508DRAFT_325790 [Ascobolus immersus RN42]|uniref:F-box domain-containing protein n=1 Tax=Ascobolus immersus RN42 TaxID=1160509 RepID=A0A3N4I852_ASCIM|nr:hypothetical protein BJ508DRAFT_325790 [Ascobolus immersus RN42]